MAYAAHLCAHLLEKMHHSERVNQRESVRLQHSISHVDGAREPAAMPQPLRRDIVGMGTNSQSSLEILALVDHSILGDHRRKLLEVKVGEAQLHGAKVATPSTHSNVDKKPTDPLTNYNNLAKKHNGR